MPKTKKRVRLAESKKPTVIKEAAIISPWVDFLCAGGVSIVGMICLLAYLIPNYSPQTGTGIILGNVLLLQALINWPHFMASYRLLYMPLENIRRYKSSAIYVPAVLLLAAAAALLSGGGLHDGVLQINQDISYIVWLIAAFYLAWHYTGQTWGMISVFSQLHGIQLDNTERRILQGGLKTLLVWHVVWGGQDLPVSLLGPLYPYVPWIFSVASIAALISFLAGVGALLKLKRRTGKSLPAQMLAPWLAIYVWYLVLFIEPNAYIYVQLSHSLQYLIFPLRIELNRKGIYRLDLQAAGHLAWSARYYLVLVVSGGVFFYLPGQLMASGTQQYTVAVLIASMISIHHYFVDGSIWKMGDPHVRRSLFLHLNNQK